MSQNDNGSGAALTAVSNGRPIKFTPERLEQIRNLVERGMSRQEIAKTIGATLGSLAVTCSRLGISLRRPRTLGDEVPVRQSQKTPSRPLPIITLSSLANERRLLELRLPQELFSLLGIEAHFENKTLSDLI